MSKLYGDENIDVEIIRLLQDYGHDAVSAKDMGKANQNISDEEVLEYTTSQDRAVITHNRKDFFRLHHMNQQHAGIIACTYDENQARLAKNIDVAIEAENGDLTQKLIRVYKPNI